MVRKRWVIIIASIVAVALLVAAGFWLARITKPTTSSLPADIASKLNFSPLVVEATSSAPQTRDYKLSTSEEGVLLLSFIIQLENGRTVTVSEYPQPSQFSDVPDFKDKFLENVIQKSTSVSTAGGVIILGRMAKQENKQMAVMLERGLVVFLVPSAELSEDEWRTIGDSFVLQKD